VHRGGTLAVRGAKTIGTSVATTNDDNSFPFGMDWAAIKIALLHTISQGEKFHCLVNTVELPSRNCKISRRRSSSGEHQGIEFGSELFTRDVDADVAIATELDAFRLELSQPTIEMAFFHLKFRDAVPKESAGTICPFENHYVVSGPSQLLSHC